MEAVTDDLIDLYQRAFDLNQIYKINSSKDSTAIDELVREVVSYKAYTSLSPRAKDLSLETIRLLAEAREAFERRAELEFHGRVPMTKNRLNPSRVEPLPKIGIVERIFTAIVSSLKAIAFFFLTCFWCGRSKLPLTASQGSNLVSVGPVELPPVDKPVEVKKDPVVDPVSKLPPAGDPKPVDKPVEVKKDPVVDPVSKLPPAGDPKPVDKPVEVKKDPVVDPVSKLPPAGDPKP
ncbi:MAG: hypothetical protein V4487_04790, partial [Chlamydiota bacterium]